VQGGTATSLCQSLTSDLGFQSGMLSMLQQWYSFVVLLHSIDLKVGGILKVEHIT